MIQQLAAILLPVFFITGLGYFWSKLGMPLERNSVTSLVLNVATPCLVLDSVSKLTLPVSEFYTMLASAVALFVGAAVLGVVLLRIFDLPALSFLPSLTFGNAGNMGLPLCLFAFGNPGLGLAAAVLLVAVVTQFTLAPMLQDRRPALTALLTTPVVYGSAIGVFLLVTNLRLPVWLDTTVGLLAGVAIPLSLLTLGFSLAELKIAHARISISLGAARLAIGFGVALAVAEIFGLEGVSRGVLIIQGGMPTALVCYLFSARYDRHPDDVAGIVLVSTLLSAALLPFLISFALITSR
ncbi:MAG TPA: AEC family transporter [Gammaproteobacteria bacterium]